MPRTTPTRPTIQTMLTMTLLAILPAVAWADEGQEAVAAAPVDDAVANATAADLAWLAGCWGRTEGGKTSEECWLAPAGGVLLGVHRDVSGPDRAFFEYLRLARDPEAEDRLTYFASPLGRAATPFRLVEIGDRRAVFANPEHDFPQRILYWLDAEGVLHARIEGEVDGKARSAEWQWTERPFPSGS